MISQRAMRRCAHWGGWPNVPGRHIALPTCSQGWLLLRVLIVATRRHSRRGGCGLCRRWSWAGAGRLRRSMGCWTSHRGPRKQRLTRRSWVSGGWWSGLVGADRGRLPVCPRRVETRDWRQRGFRLHWIEGWLRSHAIVNSRWLLQANRILWWA